MKPMTRLIVTPGLAALVTAMLLLTAWPALAGAPRNTVLKYYAVFTGPNTIEGEWTASGAIKDSGTCSLSFEFVDDSAVATKTLTGRKGRIVVETRGVVVRDDAQGTGSLVGTWRVLSATGRYRGMTGSGVSTVFADFVSGELWADNSGRVALGRNDGDSDD